MIQKICKTCKFALRLTSPPSPGGPLDGVDCSNSTMAAYLDTMANDYPEGDYEQEYREHGSINIWKIESMATGEECEFWQPKQELHCPACDDPLTILAWHDYQIYFENEEWKKSPGGISYECNNCHVPLDPDFIMQALMEVDEL